MKLGAHDLSLIDQNEQGRITSDVKRYKMHNDWNPTDKRFGGDIAILELTMHIQFSEYIRPICLPEIDLTKIVNGSLVGWGYYDNSKIVSNVPRKVELNIIPDGDCFRDEERVVSISTKNMFCAGKKGVAVCPGDSGSGFYGSINGKYYLRGLVSSAAIADECSKGKLALYSDIVEYMEFITSVSEIVSIKSRSSLVSTFISPILNILIDQFSFTEPEVRRSNRADLNCVDHGYAYCCILKNFTITSTNIQINSIRTIHEASKYNNNVTFLHFWVENTDHLVNFQDGLVHQTFPNLIAYVIEGYERGSPHLKNNNINLRNNLVRSNFRGVHKIKRLGINHCDVERLPEDLFYDLTSLENVNLNDNNIRELPTKLLINNPRLKVFSAQNNVIEIIPSDFFKKNPKLWVVQLNDNNIAEIGVNFKMFNNLDFVALIGNVCVNREFDVKKIGKDIFNELFINCRMQ